MTYGGTLFAAYWAQHASRLPAGYREVEYIQSSGAQWIDTGVAIDDENAISARIRFTSIAATQINGAYQGGYRQDYAGVNSGKFWLGIGSNVNSMQADLLTHDFHIDASDGSWRIDGQSGFVSRSSLSSGAVNVYAFARNERSNGIVYKCSECVYSMGITRAGTRLRSFIPCVRTADSKPGLYDLCGSVCSLTNSPFYVNSGTGQDFTWGELS